MAQNAGEVERVARLMLAAYMEHASKRDRVRRLYQWEGLSVLDRNNYLAVAKAVVADFRKGTKGNGA